MDGDALGVLRVDGCLPADHSTEVAVIHASDAANEGAKGLVSLVGCQNSDPPVNRPIRNFGPSFGTPQGASDDIETQARWRVALAKVLARRGERERAENLGREARGVHKLGRRLDPPDLQRDRMCAPHALKRVAPAIAAATTV